jgi:hypothetical protein
MNFRHPSGKPSYFTHFFFLCDRDWLRTAGATGGPSLAVTIYGLDCDGGDGAYLAIPTSRVHCQRALSHRHRVCKGRFCDIWVHTQN